MGLFALYRHEEIFKKISFPETAGRILKLFHENVPQVTFLKNCLRNFDPSLNMAIVNGCYFHYNTDMNKFLKNLPL